MRAAFYECDITPPLGGFVWGHYHEVRPMNVKDRLYARAAVMEGDDGTVAAFVTVDTCALPEGIHEAVTRRIYEYTGISPEHVCISSNHTHWGAPVCDSPEIGCFADKTYLDVFLRLTADAVTLAYKRLERAEARYGTAEAPDIAFCRDYHLKDGRTVTWAGKIDPDEITGRNSEADPTVRVLMVERNGAPVGALVNFACHQCCCADDDYTGDFSSIMSKELKKKYGEDFVAVYLPGTAGDITHLANNHFTTTPDHYRMMGRVLSSAVIEANKTAHPVKGDIKVTMEELAVPTRTMDPVETAKRLSELLDSYAGPMRARNLAYYQATCKDTEKKLLLQAVRVGDLCIYTMPGEVFIDLGKRLMRESEYEASMVVHNSNSYCGYVPTKEAFGEGYDLYETSLCYHSCLIPEAGDMMVDKLLELGKNVKE
ncbi:MAG: hypothetical protein E7643_07715 [Ruminococcaceae bacterium]|nr:hypothetical protein [Oscillospiraceae bacterium]